MRSGPEALVIGVGNLLWADEGFGVRCAEAFAERFEPASGVEIMDGGTQGLALVTDLAAAKRIVLFDAVDAHLSPAELVTIRGDDVPRFVAGRKVSLHQTSMMEVLALADLLGDGPPEELTLIGCQPVELEDYGGSLRPAVAARVPEALDRAAAELAAWGLPCQPRQAGGLPIMPAAIRQESYEHGRPAEAEAFRRGDERVLRAMLVKG